MKKGFHADDNLISVIRDSVSQTRKFVETGTHVGRSLKYIASQFPGGNFLSCEVDAETYQRAVRNCSALDNVEIARQDSETFLKKLVTEDFGRSAFWLDAHWSESDTQKEGAKEHANEPLKTELDIITGRLDAADIYVDDVRVPKRPEFQHDTYGGIACSHDNFRSGINWDDYTVFYPDYRPEDSGYHPPRGWCLITRGGQTDELKDRFGDILQWRTRWGDRGIQVATTACVRPGLLDRTYGSLNDVLEGVDLAENGTLYINVDPVPVSGDDAIKRELDVARKHFDTVHHNIGREGGSFSRAAQWALMQPTSDYFIFCEDDWEFYDGKIVFQKYVDRIERGDRILQCVTEDNGGGGRVHFPPSVFDRRFLQQILTEHPIPEGKDPERWLIRVLNQGRVYYDVTSHPGVKRKDIGTQWAEDRNIEKDYNRVRHGCFDTWDLSNYEPKQS